MSLLDFSLTNWQDGLGYGFRESGPSPCVGWCSSSGLRQADLGQIIDEVGYSLVLEGLLIFDSLVVDSE